MEAKESALGDDDKPRVVFVIGSTGTGKSKLGIDICKSFNGEVINADAIQMYKGLDIATAKVTPEEMDGIPHHLLSFLDPLDESYTVRDFRKDALSLIRDITRRQKLPVVVGGTIYYVQALLRGTLLEEDERALGVPTQQGGLPQALTQAARQNTQALYDALRGVDPVMARKLHPHDVRRIERSLEVYYQFGIPHSELIARQSKRLQAENPQIAASLLYIECGQGALAPRLERRVEKMVSAGLLSELRQLHAALALRATSTSTQPSTPCTEDEGAALLKRPLPASALAATSGDATRQRIEEHKEVEEGADSKAAKAQPERLHQGPPGLLQAIGYKEFAEYLEKEQKGRPQEELRATWESCVENLKLVTKQYARRQRSFIRNRFQKRGVPLVCLDGSEVHPEVWKQRVEAPAFEAVKRFLRGDPAEDAVQATTENDKDRIFKWEKRHCELCGVVCNGEQEWQAHLKSKKHRKNKSHKRAMETNPYYRAAQQKRGVSTSAAGQGGEQTEGGN